MGHSVSRFETAGASFAVVGSHSARIGVFGIRTLLPIPDPLGALATLALLLTACAHAPKYATDAQCGTTCKKIDACLGDEADDELKAQLCELARCESGCRANAHSPAGYSGLFQYAPKTWKSICYPIFEKRELPRCMKLSAMRDACCASICATEMIRKGGVKPWPVCGPKNVSMAAAADELE